MNKEQEFLNQIEEVLLAHEETYELGAWEEFDANRKKNKRKWPIYAWTAAAVALLFVSFGLFEMTKKDGLKNDQVLVKTVNKQHRIERKTETPSKSNPELITANLLSKVSTTTLMHKNIVVVVIDSPVRTILSQTDEHIVVEKPNAQAETKTNPIVALGTQKHEKFTPVLAGAYDSLTNRTAAITSTHSRKLTYSLVVSPSMSNKKINFGAGMELSYNLGNRFSINSGLMYTELNAKSDGKSLYASNSTPQSANLAVSGIELPLGIRYQTDGGFYAAAGVSALGLVNDKLEYNFLQENTVASMEVKSGIATEVLKVVAERKTEESIEPLSNYMGFFNFSAGKKQAFGNVNLNIGPFVKVPFNSVSSERIKLLQGGIKVSIDF